MKAVILAGGLGTRLSEETNLIPKPMLKIGDQPILWHILKLYSTFGIKEFVILVGYKGYIIKEYFANYLLHNSDVVVDLKNNSVRYLKNNSDPWKISIVDTGLNTMTGGRIKKAQEIIGDETFMLTYGDGLTNLDMKTQLEFHRRHSRSITMTAVQPDGRFGVFKSNNEDRVIEFLEKPKGDGSWINGGFFICENNVFDYLELDESCIFEQEPLRRMAADGELFNFKHNGFWKCMDTLRDKKELNEMWQRPNPPWKTW